MTEVFEMVEVDVPLCSRVYGTAPCTAALGTTGVRKCYNMRATCQDPTNFLAGTPLTLRFCRPGRIPHGVLAFPVLESVNQTSSTVNLAGADDRYGGIGRRGTLSFSVDDFTYHERGIDPYVAGRIDGTAQTDEGGYSPQSRGTFLAKLKARWTNYAGATVRLKRGYLADGVVSDETTYTYLLSDLDGPSGGVLSGQALGVLDLTDEKKALCPRPSDGVLKTAINSGDTSFDVSPTGAGAGYAASGWLCIGSEVMEFTRSSDTFTVVRGQRGTNAASHSARDTVQETFSVRGVRIDEVARQLVEDFTDTPASYITFTEWQAEADVWAPSLVLTTDVCTPTPVATLLGELTALGCNVVEDERNAKLVFRMDRPVMDGETIYTASDRTLKTIDAEDRDEERITQVYYQHKRADVTKALSDEANYLIRALYVDTDAFDLHGAVRTRKIATRWLDQGDEATATVVSWRILRRYSRAPKRVKVMLDAKDKAIGLLDVLDLTSDDVADVTGNPVSTYMQVIGRSEPRPYHEVEVELVRFDYGGRSGYIMEDTAPDYDAATATEKRTGCFIVDEALMLFPDAEPPYEII